MCLARDVRGAAFFPYPPDDGAGSTAGTIQLTALAKAKPLAHGC